MFQQIKQVPIKCLIHGIITFLPGLHNWRSKGTGGTNSARYCYSVWLRHLVMAKKNNLNTNPKIVAELGPGDSLGIGLAALLSGAQKYYAFDIVKHSTLEKNLEIFNELVKLFKNKEDIPGDKEFPKVVPPLDNYKFPSEILTNDRLQKSLQKTRIEEIRKALLDCDSPKSPIKYKVPWYDIDILDKNSVDMIYSQAVLEHVDELEDCYRKMYQWLKPSGYISHTIDFKSHGLAKDWNGHWCYSDILWKLIKGKRPYLLNREPLSTHIKLLYKIGFDIKMILKVKSQSNLTINDLSKKFRYLSKEDLTTSSVFIQAIKPN